MKIFCDGGSRGNPGKAASAFVVFDKNEKILHKDSEYLGVATNNVAEYQAVLMALKWLINNGKEEVQFILDSELVKRQLTGEYKIKNENLINLAIKAKAFISEYPYKISFTNILRGGNSVSDSLVNECLDKHSR